MQGYLMFNNSEVYLRITFVSFGGQNEHTAFVPVIDSRMIFVTKLLNAFCETNSVFLSILSMILPIT
jgi:hypothetical protein